MASKRAVSRSTLKWEPYSNFSSYVTRGKFKLGLLVARNDDAWIVFALETAATDLVTVLANHAHQIVGKYVDPSQAFLAAESYAAAWLADHKQTRGRRCACPEIDPFEPTRGRPAP